MPTEKQHIEDVTYGNAMIGQSGETENIAITKATDNNPYSQFYGSTNWASVRTKYFIAVLIFILIESSR